MKISIKLQSVDLRNTDSLLNKVKRTIAIFSSLYCRVAHWGVLWHFCTEKHLFNTFTKIAVASYFATRAIIGDIYHY